MLQCSNFRSDSCCSATSGLGRALQAEGCAPIVRAFEGGEEFAERWEDPATVATGIRVPKAVGDFLVLRAIRESGGTAVSVSDAEMVAGMRDLGKFEGISAAPDSGAALHAIRQLLGNGPIRIGERLVLFNTGGALKYLDLL